MSALKQHVQLTLASVALSTAACGAAFEQYEVFGVSDSFCVPKSYVVAIVPWLPPDKANVPKGFSFSGCWQGDLIPRPGCEFPKEVKGGSVLPMGTSGLGWSWRELAGSYVHRIALDKGSLLEIEGDGKTVVVSNSQKDWNWYVWRKAKPLRHQGNIYLEDDDQLLVDCTSNEVAVPGKKEKRKIISCNRYVQGKEYILKYSFEAKERVPHEIEKLDAQVFAQVDGWRCKK